MKTTLLLLLLSTPLFAQNSLTLFGTSQENRGSSPFPSDTLDLRTEFDDGTGIGATYARAIGRRHSVEIGLFRVGSVADVREQTLGSQRLGDIDTTTLSAMARVHTSPDGPFDLYVGAGAGYVLVDDLQNNSAGSVPIDNELALIVGAGITYDLTSRVAVAFDARYLPLTLRGRVEGETIEADMNPLMLSLGLRLRF